MSFRFSVNSDNQLLLKLPTEKTPITLGGSFAIEDNSLIYYLNEQDPWRLKYGLPGKFIFSGAWNINSNYELELILEDSKTQEQGDRLTINSKIISTESDCLVFEVITKKQASRNPDESLLYSFELFKLSGIWQADEYNQLSFVVKKNTNPDVLTLKGSWEINQNQKITYTCIRQDKKTKTKISDILEFEGFWKISNAQRIRYIISESSGSIFDFRLQLESENLYPTEGVIKYRIGIGESLRERPQEKIISLFGTWKFSRNLGLEFQMEYVKGEFHSVHFGAEVDLSRADEIIFKVSSTSGEPLGFSLMFTHKFLKELDAQAFARFRQMRRDYGVEAGIRIPF